jgi:putative CocE/NonD family hydrolase
MRRAALSILLMLAAMPAAAQRAPAFVASDIPASFTPPDRRDFTSTTHMVRMRDGVRLNTVVLRRKDLTGPAPIMLTRTPYNAAQRAGADSTSLVGALGGRYAELVEAGYILVVQDVRGKWGSEGDYLVNRPLRGPLNPTNVDHATDTYDTIDWLVKNVPGNNGRVGMIGVSYDGFTVLMGLVDPHPALKAAVPIDPMVDGWVGDDWFHNGAFRAWGVSWIFEQVGDRKNAQNFLYAGNDDYDFYLRAGSAGDMGRKLGLDQIGFWRKLEENQAYTPFWQMQAMDKVLV